MLTHWQLHQSRISSLRLPGSKADLHIPYLIRPTKSIIDTAVDEWAKVCGADIVSSTAELNGKSVVQLDVDSEVGALVLSTFSRALGANPGLRVSSLELTTLTTDVATLASTLPASHLILLTGSRKVTKPEARKERPFPSHSSSTTHSAPSSTHTSGSGHHGSKHNSTVPTTGPLLDRVQILTTPIITGVLITFLIFIPIILFGVYALVGIQVPPRMMEIGKGLTVNKDRKDQ